MVIENEWQRAFHSIAIKEPIGWFPFNKGGNVPGELMNFFISSWGTDKVSLKQVSTWSFLPIWNKCARDLQQRSPPLFQLAGAQAQLNPETPEQAQLNPEWIQIFDQVSKLRFFLRVIRKGPFGKRYF